MPELYRIGTYGRLVSHRRMNGSVTLGIEARVRMEIRSITMFEAYGLGTVEVLPDPDARTLSTSVELKALVESVQAQVQKLV